MNPDQIKKDWDSRGYSFGIFIDQPGQVWPDFVYKTDELVLLAEGKIEIEIEDQPQQPPIDEEVFITANAMHTVRNVGKKITFGITDTKNKLRRNGKSYILLGYMGNF